MQLIDGKAIADVVKAEIAETVRLRKEQGLTQEQLGEKIGVTNKTISRWETGGSLS